MTKLEESIFHEHIPGKGNVTFLNTSVVGVIGTVSYIFLDNSKKLFFMIVNCFTTDKWYLISYY